VAVTGLLLLTGCGELDPGAAAKVNGTRITDRQVSELVDAQCQLRDNLTKEGSAPVIAASRVRQESLSLLIDTELSHQFGQSEDLSANKLLARGFFGQVAPFFENLPAPAREELTKAFQEWSEGQAILVEAGSEATGEEVDLEKAEQLLNAGLAERAKWLEDAEITTDPRYAPNEQGFPGGGDGSVSRPGSDFAKSAGAAEADPEWVGGLPENQKCG
jgi:hypothetical protein